MRILLHSHSFWPAVGGLETATHLLSEGWSDQGHSVTVITETPTEEERQVPYHVLRGIPYNQYLSLIGKHDIVAINGASLLCVPPCLIASRPFVWIHQGYQVSCVDGLGWFNGDTAPLTPWASIWYHAVRTGPVNASIESVKLWLRRLASRAAAANVVVSQHVGNRLSLPRQVCIHNPVVINAARKANYQQAIENLHRADHTFTYVGRLVSEKGVDDLLYAFAQVVEVSQEPERQTISLKIVGDGPQSAQLKELAAKLGIGGRVSWRGKKTGFELTKEIEQAGICVVPSAWEEPGALVVLELLAAGKPLIASLQGGISEYCGAACLTFANRNRSDLAARMLSLMRDRTLQCDLIKCGLDRAKVFDQQLISRSYLELFDQINRLS